MLFIYIAIYIQGSSSELRISIYWKNNDPKSYNKT